MTDRCKERKDQSEGRVEAEEGERKDGGEKESGRGKEMVEGQSHCQVAIGEEEEDRQR